MIYLFCHSGMWYKAIGLSFAKGLRWPGVSPGIFYLQGGSMSKDLSIFVDESGDPGSESKCHAITRYRFSQVADYICTLELEALKYREGTEGRTSTLFFGTKRQFERNYLKKIRKKRLG